MSPWITGLIGGAIAAVLSALALRSQKTAAANRDGWKTLGPNWFLHSTFIGSFALTSLFACVLVSGGSSLPDAETQNISLVGLMATFGIMTAYLWWTIYAHALAWKGRQLRVRSALGQEWTRNFSKISSIKISEFRGDCRIRFSDGSAVIFSTYLHGAKELLERLPTLKD
ncbi:hypothetical protein N8940_02210 [Sphingomonadaceae bacterium]|nr:hypothetical protein [Sphingomonadaceae bacterium]